MVGDQEHVVHMAVRQTCSVCVHVVGMGWYVCRYGSVHMREIAVTLDTCVCISLSQRKVLIETAIL